MGQLVGRDVIGLAHLLIIRFARKHSPTSIIFLSLFLRHPLASNLVILSSTCMNYFRLQRQRLHNTLPDCRHEPERGGTPRRADCLATIFAAPLFVRPGITDSKTPRRLQNRLNQRARRESLAHSASERHLDHTYRLAEQSTLKATRGKERWTWQ